MIVKQYKSAVKRSIIMTILLIGATITAIFQYKSTGIAISLISVALGSIMSITEICDCLVLFSPNFMEFVKRHNLLLKWIAFVDVSESYHYLSKKGKFSLQYTNEFPEYKEFSIPIEETNTVIEGKFYIKKDNDNYIIYTDFDIGEDVELEKLLIKKLWWK